jgi:hypothetical protein
MAAQKTTFVVDADIRSAARSLDEIAAKEEKVAAGFRKIGNDASAMEIKVSAANRKVAEAVQGPRVTTGGGYVAAPSRSIPYGLAPTAVSTVAAVAGMGGYGRPGGHVVAAGGGSFGYGVAGEDPMTYSAAALARMSQITPIKTTAANDPHAARLQAQGIAARVAAESRVSMAARAAAAATARDEHLQNQANFELKMYEASHARQTRESQQRRSDLRTAGKMAAVGVGIGVIGAAKIATEGITKADERVVEFGNEFRPLASLGDNINNISGVREQVVAMSTEYGLPTAQVIAAQTAIESAAGDMPAVKKQQLLTATLRANKMSNADPEQVGRALFKAQSIFPEANKTANQTLSRLYHVQEEGDASLEQLAKYAPRVWEAAKGKNPNSMPYANALFAYATKDSGSAEEASERVKEMFSKLTDASKKLGIPLRGTVEDLERMAKVDYTALEDAFGNDAPKVKQFIEQRKYINKLVNEQNAIGPSRDIVGEREGKFYSDPVIAHADNMARLKQAQENLPLTKWYQDKWAATTESFENKKLGWQQMLGPMYSKLATPMAWADTAWSSITGEGSVTLGAGAFSIDGLLSGKKIIQWHDTTEATANANKITDRAERAASDYNLSDRSKLNQRARKIMTPAEKAQYQKSIESGNFDVPESILKRAKDQIDGETAKANSADAGQAMQVIGMLAGATENLNAASKTLVDSANKFRNPNAHVE